MQGPPGTGKTYTAAEQILELIAHGRTVGITGPSHAVICHLIDTVYKHARWRKAGIPRIGQRADRDNPHRHADATTMSNEQLEKALHDGELDVAAGTAWLWARAGPAASVDTLFVDEAGQLSLAGVLAVRRGTWCCSATRSSSPSRVTPRTRPARAASRGPTWPSSTGRCGATSTAPAATVLRSSWPPSV
jgi:hypothetical protein